MTMTDAELIELLLAKQICTGFKPNGYGGTEIIYGPDLVTVEAANRITTLKAERDEAWAYMSALQGDLYDAIMIKAERDRLRGGIEYVLDGYGLNGPDYRFQDGEDGDWISDRLVAALKGETP